MHDISVRIAEHSRSLLLRLVIEEAFVLLLESARHALVIVIEKRDDGTSRVREQGVAGFRDSTVGVVTDNANFVMRPLELPQQHSGPVSRCVIDNHDLAGAPCLCQGGADSTLDGAFGVEARHCNREQRSVSA
jgi:hypothetical protein